MSLPEEKYIKRCFGLAVKGTGSVSPNPLVGCVIVKDDKVIAEGYHEKYGAPHAEANALAKAGVNAKGAVLYCNLEPCCHTNKKTPPCAPAIIESGIKKVVICNIDPNPFVAGAGIKMMRERGIEVVTGVLEDEGALLNRFFFKYIKEKIPYITLKIARSLDGYISAEVRKQTWLTGPESGAYVHSLRARYDAVLVGAGTVNADNPMLNVRLAEGRNPGRIIVDGNLNSSAGAKVFNDEEKEGTILITSVKGDELKLSRLIEKGIKIIQLPADDKGKIELNLILKRLGEENISSVLVEGGGEIFSMFIKEKLFDELIFITAPVNLGGGVKAFNGEIEANLKKIEEFYLGRDNLTRFKL